MRQNGKKSELKSKIAKRKQIIKLANENAFIN